METENSNNDQVLNKKHQPDSESEGEVKVAVGGQPPNPPNPLITDPDDNSDEQTATA